jgi:3-hydroxyacyl-CoA dehydrogenase
VGHVRAEVARLRDRGRISADAAARLTALVTGSLTKDAFADADFVIEAVFEEIAVKQRVFAEVEAVVRPDCVLATNTSSLSVTEMALPPRWDHALPGPRRDHGEGDRHRFGS